MVLSTRELLIVFTQELSKLISAQYFLITDFTLFLMKRAYECRVEKFNCLF